jgi:hypothetical protein
MSQQHDVSPGCGSKNGLQTRKVTMNISNKQSRTSDKGGIPARVLAGC